MYTILTKKVKGLCMVRVYTEEINSYCTFKKHSLCSTQQLLYEVCFLLPSIIILATANKPLKNRNKQNGSKSTNHNWKVWPFDPVSQLLFLKTFVGVLHKKKSYARCFTVNYHKLYINRKLMNCRFRTKYPLYAKSLF